MRLALLIYGRLNTLSGGYLYDRNLVEHLREHGHHVRLMSLPWRNYLRHQGDNFSPALLDKLARLDVELLLQDELNHPSVWLLNRRLKERAGYPLVAIVHHLRSSEPRPAWMNWIYRWVEAHYLAGVDALIYNSQTTRRVVEGLIGASKPAVVAYPAGDRYGHTITPAGIVSRAHAPGSLQVLFLGNLVPRKGLEVVLQALNQLAPAVCRLTVVGGLTFDPGYVRAIRRQISDLGLASRVDLCGPLVNQDLAAVLRTHQVLALPSHYEGFGIAYLEAMSFGMPVIGSTAGAAWEIITPGQDGDLISPGDARALAGILASLHQDRSQLARMGLAAHRRFDRHPTWKQTGLTIQTFLKAVVKGEASQRRP